MGILDKFSQANKNRKMNVRASLQIFSLIVLLFFQAVATNPVIQDEKDRDGPIYDNSNIPRPNGFFFPSTKKNNRALHPMVKAVATNPVIQDEKDRDGPSISNMPRPNGFFFPSTKKNNRALHPTVKAAKLPSF